MEFVDLKGQFAAYEAEIRAEMEDVLRSSRYILGPKGQALESDLASWTGASRALACSSGTDALLLVLMALGVSPGDEVITTPFTFIATAEVIALLGAKPVFADIEPDTFNIDPARVEERVTSRTRGILAVSLYGQCADYEALSAVAARRGIFLVEDGCQSFGASRNGRRSCSFGDAAATSFFPSKPLGCYGDGGMAFTSDGKLADRIAGLRNHGQWERYRHSAVGINGRLDELQAAVLVAKFRHFPSEAEVRRAVGERYTQELRDVVSVPVTAPGNVHVYAQYSIRTERRDALEKHLNEGGVPTAVHYPVPLHLQEAFAHLGHRGGDFPASESAAREILSLPMSAFLSQEDQEAVIRRVRSFFGR